MSFTFVPTRAAGLARLAGFVPQAGRAYAAGRNHDRPEAPTVSGLSPWLRHRLLTEEEVLASVLARHGPDAADKFVQEVLWRSYWKGWLELRPAVWTAYRAGLSRSLDRVQAEAGLRARWQAACRGETGIEGFDDWARQLVATGWLHNHARMWFASIWIFTLRLPWDLGADFFLRHLLDGDPASNTLSWRWVGGMQTRGKTYLARPDNIAQFTAGRFRPRGLAAEAPPLPAPSDPAPRRLPAGDRWDGSGRAGLLLTEDDLSPGFLFAGGRETVAMATFRATADRSPLAVGRLVHDWTAAALVDAAARWSGRAGPLGPQFAGAPDLPALADWAADAGLDTLVTPWAPVGPVAGHLDTLAPLLAARGIRLLRVMREFDAAAWPHATHGFFRFHEHIPRLVAPLLPAGG